MNKIKLICDSASDIKEEDAKKYNIEVVPLTIYHDGKEYRDRIDFNPEEFYDILDASKELPTTSQVTPEQFLNAYEKAYNEGYESAIAVCLNSSASGTYQSAVIAKGFFEEKYGNKMRIEPIDSSTYTYLISAGVCEAGEMVKDNKSVDEILAFLSVFYSKIKAIVAVGTLEILIKKGRISSFKGLIGGVLNVKPIIKIADGQIRSVDKVRGNSAVVPKLLEYLENEMDESADFIYVIRCRDCPEFREAIEKLKEKYPNKRILEGNLGSLISLNIGTYVVGIGYISK